MTQRPRIPEESSRGDRASPGRAAAADDAPSAAPWLKVGVAAVFAGQGMVFSLAVNITPPVFGGVAYWCIHGALIVSALAVAGLLGGPLARATWAMIRERRLSIEGLFSLSLLGAFFGSLTSTLTGQGAVFYEVVAVVLAVYTIGKIVGDATRKKLGGATEGLRETFDTVVLLEGGQRVRMPLAEITEGSAVVVDPGAPVTVDGVVAEGEGYVRQTALTGEPLPVVKRAGDRVKAGAWSIDGSFVVRAEAVSGERELDGILATVESAAGRPSELQTQANELMRGFLPAVVAVAAATAIYWGFMSGWVAAVLNSMAVLLVACPCALGLATPVAVWQGLFHLSSMGLVSRNGSLIDALARTRRVFFDKTGTLSEAEPVVVDLVFDERAPYDADALKAAFRALQSVSAHPVAKAFVTRLREERADADRVALRATRVLPGQGIEGRVIMPGGVEAELTLGEAELCAASEWPAFEALAERCWGDGDKRIVCLLDGRPVAVATLEETMRDEVGAVFAELSKLGIEAEVLTGDPAPRRRCLPLSADVREGLSAEEKEHLVRSSAERSEAPVFVGDGINDARAMQFAAASVAIREGEALARASATAELTGPRLGAIPPAVRLCRDVRRRLRGNLWYAAGYNGVGIAFAATGHLHPVAAAFLMVGSSLFVTMRALRVRGGAGWGANYGANVGAAGAPGDTRGRGTPSLDEAERGTR